MSSLNALFDHASADRRHGASEIERSLVTALLDERRSWTAAGLASGARRLLSGQPAMANLRNLARELEGGDLENLDRWMRRRSVLLAELDGRLANSAWPLIATSRRVLTISRSSAVAAVLVGGWRRGWRGETVVFDPSPAGGGVDQAGRLSEEMDHVRSQPDSATPRWLAGGGVLVLVGADAVSPERLVNVGGTTALLELAAVRSVPVVVVADSGKDLPDAEIDEVLCSGPEVVEEGTGRRRPLFEAAAMDLVTERIRE